MIPGRRPNKDIVGDIRHFNSELNYKTYKSGIIDSDRKNPEFRGHRIEGVSEHINSGIDWDTQNWYKEDFETEREPFMKKYELNSENSTEFGNFELKDHPIISDNYRTGDFYKGEPHTYGDPNYYSNYGKNNKILDSKDVEAFQNVEE